MIKLEKIKNVLAYFLKKPVIGSKVNISTGTKTIDINKIKMDSSDDKVIGKKINRSK